MAATSIAPEHVLFPGTAPGASPGTGCEVVIGCHDNQVPAFVAAELERLYDSIYSTVGMFRLDGSLAAASTYAVWTAGSLSTLLLYRRRGNVITVMNGSITLAQADIERFARTMFARHRAASVIVFNAIRSDIRHSAYPVQRHHYGEDIVVTLPDSAAAYLANLGRNMRDTIKRYTKRLRRSHPSFRFEVRVDGEANDAEIRELFRLHRARIENKNEVSNIGDDEIDRIVALVKTNGLVTIARIDGRICGGMVCWRAGTHYFMRTVAHDPCYDDVKLGTLCCYLTINECIARGGKAFHFSPGRMIYKYRFLGEEQYYDRLVLYRSRLHVLFNARLAAKNAVRGGVRAVKLWLLDAELRDDRASRAAFRGLRAWRAYKSANGGTAQKLAAAKAAWTAFDTEPARAASCVVSSAEATRELLLRRHALAEPALAQKAGPRRDD